MFKWNAQIIIDSFNEVHKTDETKISSEQSEMMKAATNGRFPSVDQILNEISSGCEKRTTVA